MGISIERRFPADLHCDIVWPDPSGRRLGKQGTRKQPAIGEGYIALCR
jgi:hypothetical protein